MLNLSQAPLLSNSGLRCHRSGILTNTCRILKFPDNCLICTYKRENGVQIGSYQKTMFSCLHSRANTYSVKSLLQSWILLTCSYQYKNYQHFMCTEHLKFSVPRWEYEADETGGSTTASSREDTSVGDWRVKPLHLFWTSCFAGLESLRTDIFERDAYLITDLLLVIKVHKCCFLRSEAVEHCSETGASCTSGILL